MSKNEMELIGLVREHDDPGRALQVAAEVILTYLKQHGSSEVPAAADPPVPAGTSQ